jgi:hypothetical protein
VETGLAVADLHSAIPFVGLTKESRPGVWRCPMDLGQFDKERIDQGFCVNMQQVTRACFGKIPFTGLYLILSVQTRSNGLCPSFQFSTVNWFPLDTFSGYTTQYNSFSLELAWKFWESPHVREETFIRSNYGLTRRRDFEAARAAWSQILVLFFNANGLGRS